MYFKKYAQTVFKLKTFHRTPSHVVRGGEKTNKLSVLDNL